MDIAIDRYGLVLLLALDCTPTAITASTFFDFIPRPSLADFVVYFVTKSVSVFTDTTTGNPSSLTFLVAL
jgi:hypothetical protein